VNQSSTFNQLKKILRPIKRWVDFIFSEIDSLIINMAVKSIFLSNLYYLFRFKFGWEHRAVLAGKKIYKQSLKDPKHNTSLLRRNTHRLEKGLLMRPRRVPFGLNYIQETVEAFERAVEFQTEHKELIWAKHVLNEYMDITPSHQIIEPLRDVVNKASLKIEEYDVLEQKRIPYVRAQWDASQITYDELLKLAKYRRSVRWFLQDKVDRELINKAITIAAYSPTACNRQPYEFRIFDDQQLVSEIIKLPMGTTGFGHQVPNVAVVIGKLRNYYDERDRHLIYIDASLAIMSFVYALEVQGISSCCINWPDVPVLESKMRQLLGLELDERPIMLIAFGYPEPEGMVANSVKKPVDTLCKYNFIGKKGE